MLSGLEARAARRRLAAPRPEVATARARAAGDERADDLQKIEHIVILMMENHSYDNYFGMLTGRGDGFTLGPDGHPTAVNYDNANNPFPAEPFSGTEQFPSVPTQSWNASHIQWNKGKCDGFVRSIQDTVPGKHDISIPMKYWDGASLPFYYGLARTFPLATRWFCSCLGPTIPNRRFMVAGTAHGLIDDLPFGMTDYPEAGTVFDLLSAHKIRWANYHNTRRFRLVIGTRGRNFLKFIPAFFAAISPALERYARGKFQTTSQLYPLGLLRTINHLRPLKKFFDDAKAGTLPGFSIVDPDFTQWSEENRQDIQKGEAFSAQVINAVMSGKNWDKTLLIWLYDEHGGYYDHVDPPAAVEPDDVAAGDPITRSWLTRQILKLTPFAKELANIDTGPTAYDRYGFRVPAVVVSPYARPDYVTETVYDHTSILKLVQLKWNLPSLTKRDAEATAPLDALDFTKPPAFLTPPDLPPSAIQIDLNL
jgi:phospholipase C